MERTGAAAEFIDAVLAEMAGTIVALTGRATSVAAGTSAPGPAWVTTISASGGRQGTATVTLDVAGSDTLARVVMGPEGDVSPTTVAGLIRELVAQAVGALGRDPSYAGVALAVETVEPGASLRDPAGAFTITFGDAGLVHVTATASMAAARLAANMPAARAAVPAANTPPSMDKGLMATTPTANLDVVLDIDLPLRVRFGATEMSIRSLSALGPGSIVDMGRAPDDPVEILVCGRVIARAEVVVVDGNYGVRVTDLLSAAERVRALEGQW